MKTNPELEKQIELNTVVGENKVWVYKPPTAEPQILSEITSGIHPNPYWPRAKLTEEQKAPIKAKLDEMNKVREADKPKVFNPEKPSRFNSGKRKWSLLPLEVLEPIIEVLEFGAEKYAAWNFTKGTGLSWTEVGESMQRHLNAWMRGEDLDPESGKSHLGHIGCNLVFLLYYRVYYSLYGVSDDREKR